MTTFDEEAFRSAVFTKTAVPSKDLEDPRKPVRSDTSDVMAILDNAYAAMVAKARVAYDAYAAKHPTPLSAEERKAMLDEWRRANPYPGLNDKPPEPVRPPLCSWETYLAECIHQTKQELKACRHSHPSHYCSVGAHTEVSVWHEDATGKRTALDYTHYKTGLHWLGTWPMWQVDIIHDEILEDARRFAIWQTMGSDFS